MADLTLRGLTVTPAGSRRPVVADVDLDLRHGERVLLVGPSGAGKSTVLRALAGLLEDDVDASGEVLLDGRAPRAGEVGLLVQDPLDAVVAELAGRDTAFGPENAGLDRSLIWQRVARAHAAARYTAGRDREVVTLSGGERQRLALAGTLAADPGVLLLDEPTSMLDAPTARAVRAAVLEAARDRGLVVVDHDLAGWAPHVDRVVVLGRDGRVRADGPPDRVLADPALLADGLWLPGAPAPQPLDLPAGLLRPDLHVVGDVLRGNGLGLVRRRRGLRPTPPVTVLHDVDVTLRAGVTTPLTGDSGSGKSSLLAVLGGLERPTGDLVAATGFAPPGRPAPHTWRSRDLAARTGWVPQSPEHSFLATDVRGEVRATPGSSVGTPPGPTPCSTSSACGSAPTSTPSGSPAANNDDWRSRPPWPPARRCCSPTNRASGRTGVPGPSSRDCSRVRPGTGPPSPSARTTPVWSTPSPRAPGSTSSPVAARVGRRRRDGR